MAGAASYHHTTTRVALHYSLMISFANCVVFPDTYAIIIPDLLIEGSMPKLMYAAMCEMRKCLYSCSLSENSCPPVLHVYKEDDTHLDVAADIYSFGGLGML